LKGKEAMLDNGMATTSLKHTHFSKGVSTMGSSICFDSDDAVERVRQRVLEEAEEKTRLLTCPEHRQPVKLTFDGNALTISS